MKGARALAVAVYAFLGVGSWVKAGAQAKLQPVSWSTSLGSKPSSKPGSHLMLDVTAHIEDGWHVYGLNQGEGGPTPLRITPAPNSIVQLAGTPSGTAPVRRHDPSFDLDTEVFNHLFTLHVPLVVTPHVAEAGEEIGLNVRFQACNDHVCLPPRTVHLSAPARGN